MGPESLALKRGKTGVGKASNLNRGGRMESLVSRQGRNRMKQRGGQSIKRRKLTFPGGLRGEPLLSSRVSIDWGVLGKGSGTKEKKNPSKNREKKKKKETSFSKTRGFWSSPKKKESTQEGGDQIDLRCPQRKDPAFSAIEKCFLR